jgi:taurine dioxygenase
MNERVNPSVARPVVSQHAGVSIRRVGVNLGAEISGVDLREPLSDAQFAAVQGALVENELLIFRNQNITSENLMAFGRRFGELTVHPFAPNEGKNAPELIKFRNDVNTPPFGTDVWHSDETFRAEPPMATVLCAKEVPAVGGDTVFASMTAAFDGLSDRMQQYVSGLVPPAVRPKLGRAQETSRV